MRILRLPDTMALPGDALTDRIRRHAHAINEGVITVWYPSRAVSFSKRDSHQPAYRTAKTIAESNGYDTCTRQTGGTAVAFTGATLSFAIIHPLTDPKSGIQTRFDDTTETLQRALWNLGIPAQHGEPSHSFCPGNHSLQFNGKLAGVAQHVSNHDAVLGGIVIVNNRDETARILEELYETLEYEFDPASIGSLTHVKQTIDPETVRREIETAFAGTTATIDHLDRNE